MAESKNILIGYGETLMQPVKLKKGGGKKIYPYTISEARQRLSPQIQLVEKKISSANIQSAPRGEGVAKFVLHPAFLAKSYFPNGILKEYGLRHIGSKSTIISPIKSLRTRTIEGGEFTSVLFVSGSVKNFNLFDQGLRSHNTIQGQQQEFSRIEEIEIYDATDRIKWIEDGVDELNLEVSLHASSSFSYILDGFVAWVNACGGVALIDKAIYTPGLIFLPVKIDRKNLNLLAEYSYLRTVRSIAPLRIHDPVYLRKVIDHEELQLPTEAALNSDLRVAIFDGGIGNQELQNWVSEYTWPDTVTTKPALLAHGNAVTSTVLFGEVPVGTTQLPRPYANVAHYRVIAPNNSQDPDLFDVLKKIDWVIQNHDPQFINLSLGPRLPIDDDDVHAWTTLLDFRLSSGNTLTTVAVGNDGEKDDDLARIQPPSDMVNALGIGASNSKGNDWQRAPYSCIGPGRSPGLVKPDGLAFGGSDGELMKLYSPHMDGVIAVKGTSFSSPSVLRTAIGVSALSASPLSATAIKALLIHRAEKRDEHTRSEVGWGRFMTDPDEMITCKDNEAMVIYQGVINPGQPIRARIPFPNIVINGQVTIKATFCFTAKTDPAHPINYTKSGLNLIFRPKGQEKKTVSFFNQESFQTEQELRSDAQKWETCMSRVRNFRSSTLDDPVFDIEYLTRDEGKAVSADEVSPLPYVLIITISVKDTPGVYNNILQRYQTLQPIKLRTQVQIKL